VAIFDLNAELGETHAKAISGAFFKVDVTDENEVASTLEKAEGLHGKARHSHQLRRDRPSPPR
jgi:hypothetical protein